MNKELLEKLVNKGLDTGADFSEIFYEDTKEVNLSFSSSVIDKCTINNRRGVGIRLAKDTEVYYADTNNVEEENLINMVNELNQNFDGKRVLPNISLTEITEGKNATKELDIKILNDLKSKLYEYDKFTRSLDNRIIQFVASILTSEQNVIIANSKSALATDKRLLSRLYFKIVAKENEKSEFVTISLGSGAKLELPDDEKISKLIKEKVEDVIEKLDSKSCPGGEMPVVIANGFGGVLIHEACGHAMEATMVADGTSILADKLNTKVASSKVTIIDDGTIPNAWGSTKFDDEGNKTNKNILIENGVLKKYLIDEISTRMMNGKISGSGRRQDFTYAPTSRMNNTYMQNGSDKFEDMISSIEYGLYAKTLGGGQVDPATGDFNFAVQDAYMIRNGKIAEPVKGASLVGNTTEILNRIEMVGNDLELSAGTCGSISGWVPVNVGQPTIKLSKILVGGENNAK